MAARGLSGSGGQFALEGMGGVFHHQLIASSSFFASLFGYDKCNRKLTVGSTVVHPSRVSLARRHARALVAAAFLPTEKNFRRIMGYRDLWALKAILRGEQQLTIKQAVP